MRFSSLLLLGTLACAAAVAGACATRTDLPWGASTSGTATTAPPTSGSSPTPSPASTTFPSGTSFPTTCTGVTGLSATSITVVSTSGFLAGDQLLIWQVQYRVNPGNGLQTSTGKSGPGVFESTFVESVGPGTLNLESPLANTYQARGTVAQSVSATVQVCRIPYFNAAIIPSNGTLAPTQAWDGTSGGVVALRVHQSIELDGIIDVSGAGFRGALPLASPLPDPQPAACGATPAPGTGEGEDALAFNSLVGPGSEEAWADSGIAGTGWLAGGGGGSNGGAGGNGGDGSITAVVCASSGGYAGKAIANAGTLFFGGGGGQGFVANQAADPSPTPAPGGNGGGLLLLLLDSGAIATGNGGIHAGGAAVGDTAQEIGMTFFGGAGGGAGGTILVFSSDLQGTLSLPWSLDVSGGQGQSVTNFVTEDPGGGGGGGGGVIISNLQLGATQLGAGVGGTGSFNGATGNPGRTRANP